MLAGTDAGTGVRGHVGVWVGFCCSAPQSGRRRRGGEEGHTQERTRECWSARVIPRAQPFRPLIVLVLIGLETKGLLDFQGRRGLTSAVRWNLRPVIFDVDNRYFFPFSNKGIQVTLPQKESGKRRLAKNVTKKVTEASEKVTKK